MCGIFGIVSSVIPENKVINDVLDALKHRGPDDEGYVFFNKDGHFTIASVADSSPDFQETHIDILDADLVHDMVSDLQPREITLSLPKFEFESGFSLKDILVQLGMPDAFSANADFSGMTGNRDLFISDVVHKAFVSVDEEGTEAAAATAAIMALTGLPENPLELKIDRPFIFLIRDIETGTILFIGRVLNPDS